MGLAMDRFEGRAIGTMGVLTHRSFIRPYQDVWCGKNPEKPISVWAAALGFEPSTFQMQSERATRLATIL
jgi:hypothetical protein